MKMQTLAMLQKEIKTLVLILFPSILMAQFSLMSYNIRYNNPNDGENWWEHRKVEIVDLIKTYNPSILGIQEGLDDQVLYLDSALKNYSFIGVGRDDGEEKGEYTAIFFEEQKMELLKSKTYWLSESPDVVSVGWDASMERIVTYAQFLNKTSNQELHVFNCHFDHIGSISRANSAKLILKLIRQLAIDKEQVAVIGDLNCLPDDDPIDILKTILKDSYSSSRLAPLGPVGTFSGFKLTHPLDRRIDYILTKNIAIDQYEAIADRRKNKLWPSDHLPVMVHVK